LTEIVLVRSKSDQYPTDSSAEIVLIDDAVEQPTTLKSTIFSSLMSDDFGPLADPETEVDLSSSADADDNYIGDGCSDKDTLPGHDGDWARAAKRHKAASSRIFSNCPLPKQGYEDIPILLLDEESATYCQQFFVGELRSSPSPSDEGLGPLLAPDIDTVLAFPRGFTVASII
jgi:hypothetical protein